YHDCHDTWRVLAEGGPTTQFFQRTLQDVITPTPITMSQGQCLIGYFPGETGK
ncbi:hypothetical protein P7K49_022901, partial [Saguinus oedipus]